MQLDYANSGGMHLVNRPMVYHEDACTPVGSASLSACTWCESLQPVDHMCREHKHPVPAVLPAHSCPLILHTSNATVLAKRVNVDQSNGQGINLCSHKYSSSCSCTVHVHA